VPITGAEKSNTNPKKTKTPKTIKNSWRVSFFIIDAEINRN